MSKKTGKDLITVSMRVPIERQLLRDLLCTAVEQGSTYWAEFSKIERTKDGQLDYLSVLVTDIEADEAFNRRFITSESLATGLERMAQSGTRSALRHLADALSRNGDATTADVVLQWTIFGEVKYG